MALETETHIPTTQARARPNTASREKKRRRRTRPHEVDILMSAYVRNAFPNERTREELAELVGMSTRAVSVWFQNRRQAEKKRSMRYHATQTTVPTMPAIPTVSTAPVQNAFSHSVAPLGMSAVTMEPSAPVFLPREPFVRSHSTPAVSLMTTSGGRAALGERPALTKQNTSLSCTLECTNDGHGIIAGGAYNDDRAIWQRMESSSALESCTSDADADMDLHMNAASARPGAGADQEDDEERTLRRLARRRLQRMRERKRAVSHDEVKRPVSDARLVMQEHRERRWSQSLQSKPSMRLEWAADRDLLLADKENVKPSMQHGEHAPAGSMQEALAPQQPTRSRSSSHTQAPTHTPAHPLTHVSPQHAAPPPPPPPQVPLSLSFVPPSHGRNVHASTASTNGGTGMSVNASLGHRPLTRRAISASTSSTTTSPISTKPTTTWTRTSSTRSSDMMPATAKDDVPHDDSGFFEDGDRSDSFSPPTRAQPQHVLNAHDNDTWTEHDHQAAELLLGLGSASRIHS